MSRQQFSTISCGFFSPETEYSTYEERHRQQLVVGLNISLASVSFPWNSRFLEGDYSYEEQHRQQLVVVAARQRHQGAGLTIVLAWTSDLEFLVSEESFTYEEQHRQGRAAVEGRRPQQLEEEGRVLLRVVVEALRLCSSLRRLREEEEGGLQPGVAAGRRLLLGAVVVAGHLRRRQEVCKGQSHLFVGVG